MIKKIIHFSLAFCLFAPFLSAQEGTGLLEPIEKALSEYEKDVGTFPGTQQGLAALVRRPITVDPETWKGPYLPQEPVDLWGEKYDYQFPGAHDKPFDLFSKGPDRIAGTDDDIINWTPEKPRPRETMVKNTPEPLPPDLDPSKDYVEKAGGLDMEMIWINSGQFTYGSRWGSSGSPLVFLDGYWIGKHEVTARQYCIFLNAVKDPEKKDFILIFDDSTIIKKEGKFIPRPGCENKPAYPLSWVGANAFCEMLSKGTKRKYLLPTEAQWERAARGGLVVQPFPWGNENPDGRANFGRRDGKAWENLMPVGTYPPNRFGIYDVAGNVMEWCRDWFDGASDITTSKNPAGPEIGNEKVLKGGNFISSSQYIRPGERFQNPPWYKAGGFRLVREP
ncbi:MAG TPA: SUMF1/EgtB/PvdO family nonheme iron enzyme [Candidatus Sumerlaeota bacterium]|nr:MAG: Serine/threonine-protein kinase pkn1 [candidate division BRC1 bacterium ADurb.Bin183]HOE64746.1 SUMF1/EgtB/PvdO family nonheme iron enzyme [Candidatus Sumerlaeota bacterium]HRR31536.1 SUMF1/EgtB/PvdO family nonheme iron enzyme [Candidatus Sumerlaeia bacterium]HON50767.1 SUMF1/EgtB/PvdO family nonheme iron enzyme [Candidatus Sumerlaeota bacterium]HOR65115.1 SUMF1/EgtB/PvdO family nonheme iron enzyme [Candidatus Sumerlaeota bacterium]